jgi:hypothetical protein
MIGKTIRPEVSKDEWREQDYLRKRQSFSYPPFAKQLPSSPLD